MGEISLFVESCDSGIFFKGLVIFYLFNICNIYFLFSVFFFIFSMYLERD